MSVTRPEVERIARLAELHVDEVRPVPLARSPSQLAPAFRDGFFLVPRLGAFGAGAAGGDDTE